MIARTGAPVMRSSVSSLDGLAVGEDHGDADRLAVRGAHREEQREAPILETRLVAREARCPH